MSFNHKSLQSPRSNMSFIKGATLFFLGMSCILFMARAFDITPTSTNALMYIRSIFLTTDGSNASPTRITLDGLGGNGTFAGDILVGGNGSFGGTVTGSTLCLTNDSCITQRPTEGSGTLGTTGAAGATGATGLLPSGTTGATPFWNGSAWSTGNTNIYNTGYNIGIGTSSPSQKLEVNGTGKFLGLCLGSDCRSIWPAAGLWLIGASNSIYYTGGNVGINQATPTANLDVKGTVKMLSSLKAGGGVAGGYSTGGLWYFPGGVRTGSLNTAASGDTIWYFTCSNYSLTGAIYILGLTGSNVSITNFANVYFLLPGFGSINYHLKAGETFATLSSCPDKMIAYRQNFGQDVSVGGGGGLIVVDPNQFTQQSQDIVLMTP